MNPRIVVAASISGKIDKKVKNARTDAFRPDRWSRHPSSISTIVSIAPDFFRIFITLLLVCHAIESVCPTRFVIDPIG